MTNNIRVFLWLAVALALYINYTQWQLDFAPKAAASAVAGGSTDASGGPKQPSLDDAVPQVTQPATAPTADAPPTVASAIPTPTGESTAPSQVVRVVTDVLTIDIDLRGGTLVRAELPGYPVKKGQPEAVVLFNHDDPATNYEVQSGIAGVDAENSPTHRAMFSSEATKYTLAAGQQELRVPLTWTDGQGVTVSKTFVFHRSMFTIGLEYAIDNKSNAPWSFAAYTRLSRNDPPVERSMFVVESFATRGPAIWDPNGKKYQKLDIEKSENQNLSLKVTGGWLAGIQHHFVGAIVPDQSKPYTYTLKVVGRQYVLGAEGALTTIAPGKSATIKEQLFVGPKLQRQLDSLHEELSRVADYGILTPLSKPLFLLLDYIHGVVKNWGVAIILATFLLKLLFYPLSEKAGRSMAKMRELTPRMKALQETYKDDRSKLGQATMDLYRTEKVNPLAGCLPMIIQMPVFLAFYWVLLESVEMRQAPFMLWITDLSSRDPFFILPALNGLAMWIQYKLNPPPPDPVQAKVFQFMPLVFSVMFALFPAGLVLYWVTNTGLSILQQWNINRKISAEKSARNKR
ncbi:MAG: membrane protein insertase YidC [Steroidobacteraceae bacterium]|nr:membrane protein insertase YidC [Steroidobacteraceae bacterium]